MVERREKTGLWLITRDVCCIQKHYRKNCAVFTEAVNTAVYTLNRVPTKGEDKTPYEKWFGKKPSVKHLRVFGTTCYILIPKQLRKKWKPKSRRGKLVGYTDTDKNFRIWDEEKKRVDICRDVKFDDTSELSNKTNISLDMLNEKDQPHCIGSLGNHQEKEENENPDEDDENYEETQPQKAGRPVGS